MKKSRQFPPKLKWKQLQTWDFANKFEQVSLTLKQDTTWTPYLRQNTFYRRLTWRMIWKAWSETTRSSKAKFAFGGRGDQNQPKFSIPWNSAKVQQAVFLFFLLQSKENTFHIWDCCSKRNARIQSGFFQRYSVIPSSDLSKILSYLNGDLAWLKPKFAELGEDFWPMWLQPSLYAP